MAVDTLRVFYTDRQTVPSNTSFSPSAGKPAKVVESWKGLGLPLTIIEPAPVTRDDLALAHSRRYVDAVLDGKQANGFGNTLAEVAASLPYTTGSLAAAARDALQNGRVAVSPTSGFHHAGYDNGGGFCTFNGLVVTAQMLKQGGNVERVGILDIDKHYGNGTDDIIRRLKLDYIQHYTFGGDGVTSSNAWEWLTRLPGIVKGFKGVDVLLYQAGADPHINDPLGGVLTTEQMAKRDQIVFEVCRDEGIPVAWNLAGGYQQPLRNVLDLHDTTAKKCVDILVDQQRAAGKI